VGDIEQMCAPPEASFLPLGEKSTENAPPSCAKLSQMICSGWAAAKTAELLTLTSMTAKKPNVSLMILLFIFFPVGYYAFET
jgi:hypothetical protein